MKNFLFSTFTAEFGWVCPFFCWVWVDVSFYGMNVGECGCVQVSATFFGCVWVGVGECDLFFGWMWVDVGECDLFFGWMYISNFIADPTFNCIKLSK